MKNLKFVFILLTVAILFSSCTKKGDTGPAGPAGNNGTNGTDGNANVTSYIYEVTSWSTYGSYYYAQLSVPALTSTTLSNSAVQVFLSTDAGASWTAVPFTVIQGSNYEMWFSTTTGTASVYWEYFGAGMGSDPNSYYSCTCKFKVVVIPPISK